MRVSTALAIPSEAVSVVTWVLAPAAVIAAFVTFFWVAPVQDQAELLEPVASGPSSRAALFEPFPPETPVRSEMPSEHLRVVTDTVQRADTLTALWARNGGSHAEALAAHDVLKAAHRNGAVLNVGDEVEFGVNREGAVRYFRRTHRSGLTFLLEHVSGGFSVRVIEPAVSEHERVVTGTVESSFFEALREQDVPLSAIDEFVDLFSARFEFRRSVQPGDSFAVMYTELRDDGGSVVGARSIDAALLSVSGKTYAAVRYEGPDKVARYFGEDGKPLGSYFLRYPLKFSRISSMFSESRFHPVLKVRRPHNGVDFAAPVGTPVRAVGDGVIEIASYKGGAGNMVRIRHCDRWSTAYLHLHKIAPGLRPGARVARGQEIGTVGRTGLATGPHLHFSLYDRGRYVDPMRTSLPSAPDKNPIPKEFLTARLDLLAKHRDNLILASAHADPTA